MQMSLNEYGDYVWKDNVGGVAALRMTEKVNTRVGDLLTGTQFILNCDGIRIVGRTCLDPLRRRAMEWTSVGDWREGDVESFTPVELPPRQWRRRPVRRSAATAVVTQPSPWWKFWA